MSPPPSAPPAPALPLTAPLATPPGPRTKGTLIRWLALARLRELRRAGMRYREIAANFALPSPSERGTAPRPRPRVPPGRLLEVRTPPAESLPALRRATLARAVDALAPGLAFFDCTAALLHANRALRRILDDARAGDRLRRELELFALALCDLVRLRALGDGEVVEELAHRGVPSVDGPYHLRGSYLGLDLFGRGHSVLIQVDHSPSAPPSDAALAARFGLTRRERQVARLLAEGWSNDEIAARLAVSPHTARRHTENVHRKLGVHSRARVAARLLQVAGAAPGPWGWAEAAEE